MKKILVIFLIIFILLQFTSCILYTNHGIENFHIVDSGFHLNHHLFPEDFLELYPYIDGGYDYYEKCDLYAYATSLLFMEYDEETYAEAKEYALSHLTPVPNSEQLYKGYNFIEHSPRGESAGYRFFFTYSDDQHVLLSVATYMTGYYEYNYTSLPEYIETYFPFYNFDEAKIEQRNTEGS